MNVVNKKLQADEIKQNEGAMRETFMKRVQEQNYAVQSEMNTMKGALSDYMYDNYNRSK